MTSSPTRAPLPIGRRSHVLAALARDGMVRISDLTAELGVTPVTLRRDLAQLESEGLLVRVHGGAVPAEGRAPVVPEPVATDTTTIAVLVPSLDYYWPGVVRGMEAEARRQGLRLLLRGSSYELEDERPVLGRLRSEGVKGLIFAPNIDSPHAQDVVDWLTGHDLPTVLIERDAVRSATREPLESVTTDHALGAVQAAHHLADLGHRRVGLVLSRYSPTSRKIAAGWDIACTDLGLARNEHFESILPDRRTPEFAANVEEIIDTAVAAGTTALVVHSDPEAIAIIEHALARGIRVPGDLSVIAYDDEVAQLYNPGLTAVSPPRAEVGRIAVQLLARRLGDPGLPAQRVIVSPQLTVRESTAPPPLA